MLHLTAERAIPFCDENTIGVVAILGSTYDGSYEPVAEISAALDKLQADSGLDIPIHVDAASGGFVAPFSQPDLIWDFQLERVQSINASGHKFGLVYPGVGWVIWRDAEALPKDLIFNVNYLGGDMPTFAINFSRPGSQIVAQYYTFLRLGRAGFKEVQDSCIRVAGQLIDGFERVGPFEAINRGDELPVIAVKLKDEVTGYTVFDISRGLRAAGWQVPAYTFPANMEKLAVLRVVVRHGMTSDLADLLLGDLERVIADLEKFGGRTEEQDPAQTFHH